MPKSLKRRQYYLWYRTLPVHSLKCSRETVSLKNFQIVNLEAYLTTIGTPCLTAMIEAMGSAVYGTPQYRPPGLGTATGNTLGTKRNHGVVNVSTLILKDFNVST
jgi:hypothetical protein